jgi:hypothetical protein
MFDRCQCTDVLALVETLMQVLYGGAAMSDRIDVVELAHEIAKIASTTTDPDTGRQLMKLVERLLGQAGLPSWTERRPN